MLYTRNAFHFRRFHKEEVAKEKYPIDLNFIGSTSPGKNDDGFAKLIYGNREDVGKLLATIALNVAADDQAIYELIQNADDCKSSFFSVSYNKEYLLCINNGNYFSDTDMSAIINVAGNYKDGEDIGTFGIGFKILHRLVGADDGREAIINDYAGPIIFSWNKFFQLESFLNDDEIKVGFDLKKDSEYPWLVKLLYTCFPSHLEEKLKLQDYVTEGVKFSKDELSEMRTFLIQSLQNVNLRETNNLKTGSIFFLKLGKGKSIFLEEGIDKIKSGLSYSFKFLNSLQKIYINGEEIKSKAVLDYSHSFPIGSNEFNDINPKNKNRDIKFTFAFYRDYKKAVDLQNEKAPNLYTFFSMDEEKNGFSFLLHCNAFDMNNDRRKLQSNSQINEKLLPKIAQNIIKYSDKQKDENRSLFLSLYANFLLSKEPQNKSHINNSFSKFIHQYISEKIPTKNGFSINPQNVKINKLKLQLNLIDFGLKDIEWFEWDNEADNLLIEEAKSKLGIESWYIKDIVENADLDSLNNWIATCDNETYKTFLKELEDSTLRNKTKERIRQIKLFEFSNGAFYSFNEIVKKPIIINNKVIKYTHYGFSNVVFKTPKIEKIVSELNELEIFFSEIKTSEFPNIFSSIEIMPDEIQIYNIIAEKCKTNTLTPEQKKNLFLNFINETTKFDNVAEGTLKELCLFCDNNSEIMPLKELIGNINTSSWLDVYKIKKDEYFSELNSYLIQEEELFDKFILPNIEIIKDELTVAKEIIELVTFFKNKPRPFFNEYIIQKEANGFAIINKYDKYQIIPSKDERKSFVNFIESHLSDNFIVLPYDFSEFNDQDGILKGEKLHSQILALVEVDEHKETLVDIIHYYESKRKLFRETSEFRFKSGAEYNKEDYEYKILDLACSDNMLNETDYRIFRERVVIETDVRSFSLSEIQPIADKIKISNKEFSLSKVMPVTHQNSNLVGDLISLFTQQGISNEKLNALFGVNEELDIQDIFEKYTEQTEIFENTEQFFFLVYYNQHIEKVDLSKLGFDLNCAVYPSEFALEKERLPEYLLNWITNKEINLSQLESIGVFTENSMLVSLRKFFLSKSEFNVNVIAEKLSSNGTMLLNTFELLKEKGIELSNENEFSVFKEIVRVINSSRAKGQELIIQVEYNLTVLEEKSTEWKTINEFSIYLHSGALPKFVKLDEIEDYVFYHYCNTDFFVNGNKIYLNENANRNKVLMEVATFINDNNFTLSIFGVRTDETEKLKQENEELKKQLKGDRNQDEPEKNNSFLDEVKDFIFELEGTEWNSFVPELRNILELSVSHPKEKQKLFNLIAKIKLTKIKNIKFEDSDEDFNSVSIGKEKYFVHSARGAFAYIHPNEILKMKDDGYKMALDFNTKSIVIYETAEEILQLNTNHILAYQYKKSMDELFSFCQANRDANKHLLIIDKNNSGEKSRALLKLLNIEDDYQ
jgi:hypothetical protein